jgi:hypothetical protein
MSGCGSSSKGGTSAATTRGTPTTVARSDGGAATTAAEDGATVTTSAAGGTPQVDACSLLSDSDVNTGFTLSDLHSTITDVKRTPNVITSDTSECDFQWTAQNESSSNFALYVYPASTFDDLKSGSSSQTVPEIPGALRSPDGFFLKAGPVTLSITGVASTEASGKLLQEAAAKVGG